MRIATAIQTTVKTAISTNRGKSRIVKRNMA
jgi:hypothetical protein